MEVIKRRKQQQCTFLELPREIQLEIRSRLPIKDLFRYRCVCKRWSIHFPDNDKTRMLPLCGLVFKDTNFHLAPNHKCNISYISMGTKHIIPIKTENNKQLMTTMTINSGFDKGSSLADLSFEFGSLSSLCEGDFFTIHRGLILVGKKDLTLQIHNPVTKLVFPLPIPPFVQYCLLRKLPPSGNYAFLINYNPIQVRLYFHFLVVRLFSVGVEIYYSTPRRWRVFRLIDINGVSDKFLREIRWSCENYVFIYKTQTLVFLTNGHHGLALEIKEISRGLQKLDGMRLYKFPLPPVVKDGFKNARLGENQECLFLSYHDVVTGGVWFWKREVRRTSSDNDNVNDRWVLLLEIGKTAKLSRSLELNHNDMFKLMKVGDTIIPIGFHPDFAVSFLHIKSCFFAYDLNNKTLEKIAEIDDQDYKKSTVVFPFIPCVVPRLCRTISFDLSNDSKQT